MAKQGKTIYAPGELDRVRGKLGDIDDLEARRMADILGGDVGYERTKEQQEELTKPKPKPVRQERVDVKIGNQPSLTPKNRIELAGEVLEEPIKTKPKRQKPADPSDDPSVSLRCNYWDRIKMDQYAGLSEFEIKSPSQVLFSIFSIFGDIPDYVNPLFITKRMAEYYQHLEALVLTTRTLFPRNNIRRNERIKKNAPLVFAILDTIRYWNIEKITGELAKLQAHPGRIKVGDCADMLRIIYRPLFVLDRLDMDVYIRSAYKILYKALYVENPIEAQSKYQDLIKTALAAYSEVQLSVRYLMYPLLMKSVSVKWLPYRSFFAERKNRIMAFLRVTEEDQIDPEKFNTEDKAESENGEAGDEKADNPDGEVKEEKPQESPEEKAQREAEEAEKKALDKGLQALELLFPGAGWDHLDKFPDLYPYFVDVFGLRRGYVNIPPTDSLQQISILMRIIEELFFGLRSVAFGFIIGPDGEQEHVEKPLAEMITNWHYFVEYSFEKEYLPRLSEYVRMLEGSPEEWNSPYTKKIVSDLHWIKRLYFLPFYKFESFTPPSFQKKDITSIYPEIKKLRRYMAGVAAGIEAAAKAGGPQANAHCDSMDNPWHTYVFQVPNPVSRRMDALLTERNKNNAALIYFTLAVVTVLDKLVNDENSWAYSSDRPGPLFRSIDGQGSRPLTGVDEHINADALFKASLKKRQKPKG